MGANGASEGNPSNCLQTFLRMVENDVLEDETILRSQ